MPISCCYDNHKFYFPMLFSAGLRARPEQEWPVNCEKGVLAPQRHFRDLFHVYLNRFEFRFLRLHIKQANFSFSSITDMSRVLPNKQDGNLKHSHSTAALNTSPPPLTDLRAKTGVSSKKIRI